jgi:hypothetical protein
MFENNSPNWCSDGIDNDFDRYVHASIRAGYATNIGVDCDDYDCRSAPNCPSIEGFGNVALCFDGIDNAPGYQVRTDNTAEDVDKNSPGIWQRPLSYRDQNPVYRTGDVGRWLPNGTIESLDEKITR